jgi:hypothetical protein
MNKDIYILKAAEELAELQSCILSYVEGHTDMKGLTNKVSEVEITLKLFKHLLWGYS